MKSTNSIGLRLTFALLVGFQSSPLLAQSYVQSMGFPTFSSVWPVENGAINLANGNLHLEIPLGSFPQRGGATIVPKLVYDSQMWVIGNDGTTLKWKASPGAQGGWRVISGNQFNSINPGPASQVWTPCGSSDGYYTASDYTFTDGQGTTRHFPITVTFGGCGKSAPPVDAFAEDSSGFHMWTDGGSVTQVEDRDGTYYSWQHTRDRNGNTANGWSQDSLDRNYAITPADCIYNGCQPPAGTYQILNSSGSYANWVVANSPVSYSTAFNVPGVYDTSGSFTMMSSVTLPDGVSTYQFGYDSYGELNSLTLPTGGTVTFSYSNVTDAYGNQSRWVTSRTSGGNIWSFNPQVLSNCVSGGQDCQQQVSVFEPSGNTVVVTFRMNGGAWPIQTQVFDHTDALFLTTVNDYDFSNTCSGCTGAAYIRLLRRTDTIPSVGGTNLSRKTEYSYDNPQYGNITATKEWWFYTGTPSPTPNRETDITYLNTSAYLNANIIDKPTSITTKDASGTQVAQTVLTYDSTALAPASPVAWDNLHYTNNTIRGNVTLMQKWIAGSSFVSKTNTYDLAGQLVQTTDFNGNITSFSYTDNFFNDNGGNPPAGTSDPYGQSDAYVTSITSPIIGTSRLGYYFGSGKAALATDVNGATSYSHFNEAMDRPTTSIDALGGWILNSYTSATQQDLYTALTSATPSTSCTSCRHDQMLLDSLGHVVNTPLVNDPDGQINVVTSYNENGGVYSTTAPYRSTGDSTYGVTSLGRDPLDRIVRITRPDNNAVVNTYGAALPAGTSSVCGVTAYPSTTTDEAAHKRLYWNDGFGRLVEVDEPDGSGNLTIATCYQYDLLDNLLSATQRGGTTDTAQWRTRTYQYDGLSRLTQATTPEAGTVIYSYTRSGSPCSGDPALACSRTDARSVVTTYSYDALNRLTGKTYTVTTPATPSVSYYYDQPSYNGLQITNGIGRRTGMSDGTGQTAWSYDANGNVLTKQQTIAGVTNRIAYTYNLDGSVATMTSPNGHTYTYGYSNALRATSLSDGSITYVSAVHYAAPGLLTSATHGLNLGITETNNFNNRLQPTLLSATGGQTVLSLSYNFTLPGGVNNGSVYQIQNNRDTSNNRSFQYSYDALNRLQTAGTIAGASTPWSTTYSYDTWGNLYQKSTAGPGEPSMGPLTVDVHNHVNAGSYTYDAAGNLTFDGVNALHFDGENRMNPVTGYVYAYDGDDHRVERNNSGSITYYWYDDAFNVISTTGAVVRDYVYFNGRRVAERVSSGDQYYYWTDHIGSARTMSNSSGSTIQWEGDYYPFGTKQLYNGYLTNYFMFTDYQYDWETGDYYANYREQSPVLGRFFSPDRLNGDVYNPQSLNRYAYVLNNPLNLVDPFGLDSSECHPTGDTTTQCNVVGDTGVGFAPIFWGGAGCCGGVGGPSELLHGPFGDSGGGGDGPGIVQIPLIPKTPTNVQNATCVSPTVFEADRTQGLKFAYETSVALSRVLRRTVGVGLGGGFGLGLGGETITAGVSSSGSVSIFTDKTGNSAIVGSLTFQFPTLMSGSYTGLGGAANAGVQFTVTSQTISQMVSSTTFSVNGSVGPVAASLDAHGFSVTAGVGVGARVGAGPALNKQGVIVPICKE